LLLDLAVMATGMVLGLRFRAGALMAATPVAAMLSLVLETRGRGFGWSTLWLTVQSVIVLQLGYLVGLALGALWRRFRER
jgi:hypothetical protein